jgi:hemerythrin
MTPSEIRAGLLGEHAMLRGLMAETYRAIESARGGEGSVAGVRQRLRRLVTALRDHNEREEALLREILPRVDAWGPARAEIMMEGHEDEHAELLAALVVTIATDDASGADSVERELLRVEAHMKREEELLLSEEVLRDDDVAIDSFGG